MTTFFVGFEELYEHEIGNAKCDEGWCAHGNEYPKPCKCGGLIHADYGDEDSDEGYWLYEKCDKCGDDFDPV